MNDIVQQVIDRYAKVGEAITKGLPLAGDGAYLMADRYVYPIPVLKDNLGIGSLNAVDRPSGVNEDEKSIVFIVSTQNEDRDGDLVVSKGCRLDNYRLNPVFCWGHQSIEFPIGQARSPDGKITVWPDDNKIVAKCYFDEEDEDAMFIFGKYVRGYLNCTSMAFVPTRAFRRDYEEKARTHNQPLAPPGWVFQEYDLTEISCVTVPSNAQAAVIREWLDHEKSFITPRMQKSLAPYAAQPKGLFRGWGPLPDKDGCYFDGKSWWCPMPEPQKQAKKSCCSNCDHGKPCCKEVKKSGDDSGNRTVQTVSIQGPVIPGRGSKTIEVSIVYNDRSKKFSWDSISNRSEQEFGSAQEAAADAKRQLGKSLKAPGQMTGGGTDPDKPGDTNPRMGGPRSTGAKAGAPVKFNPKPTVSFQGRVYSCIYKYGTNIKSGVSVVAYEDESGDRIWADKNGVLYSDTVSDKRPGLKSLQRKDSQADIEGPVNDPTDRYGKVQIPKAGALPPYNQGYQEAENDFPRKPPYAVGSKQAQEWLRGYDDFKSGKPETKQLGPLKLRECVKQRIKDGVPYDKAVQFCNALIGQSDSGPARSPTGERPPRMRRELNSSVSKSDKPVSQLQPGDVVSLQGRWARVERLMDRSRVRPATPESMAREGVLVILTNVDNGDQFQMPVGHPESVRWTVKAMGCRRCKGAGVVGKRSCPKCKGIDTNKVKPGDSVGKYTVVAVDRKRGTAQLQLGDGPKLTVYLNSLWQYEKGRAPVIQKPFADYKDFADCVAKNRDKKDPEAYCGSIKNQVEGKSMKPQQKDVRRLVKATQGDDGRWALQLINSGHGDRSRVNSMRFASREDAEKWAGIKGYLLGQDASQTKQKAAKADLGNLSQQQQSDMQAVLDLVKSKPGILPTEIQRKTGLSESQVSYALIRLGKQGKVSQGQGYSGYTAKAVSDYLRHGSVEPTRADEQVNQNTGAGKPGRISAGLNEASGTAGGYVTNSEFFADATGSDPDSDTETPIGYARCPECVGTGNCSNCGGVGQIGDRTPISRAKPDTIRDCEVCGGSGDCKTCDGSGNVKKSVRKASSELVARIKRDFMHSGFGITNIIDRGSYVSVIADKDQLRSLFEALDGEGYDARIKQDAVQVYDTGLPKSLKGNPMATRTKGRRRKAAADEPFKPDPSSAGAGAGDDNAANVTKDPMSGVETGKGDDAGGSAVWQPTPLRIAMLTRQLRKMGDWLQKEISGMDNLDGGKALLQKIHDDWNAPYADALSKALSDNYSDQGYDLDKMCKQLETDGDGPTDLTGESQMVDAGQVPPDTVTQGVEPEAMPFAGTQSNEEEFLEGESGGETVPYNNDIPDKDLTNPGNPAEIDPGSDPDAGLKDLTDMGNMDELKDLCPSCGEDTPGGANFCPSCGGAMADASGAVGGETDGGKAIGGYDTSNPDTTDVDKTGYAAVPGGTGDDPSNVQPAPFNKDTDPDTDEILQRYQTPKGWRTKRVGTVRYGADGRVYLVGNSSKALSDAGNPAEVKPGSHGPGEGQIIMGSGMLKDMADGLDQIGSGSTGINQAALSGYSASLRKLLTDGGKTQETGGEGDELSNPGNPEELKDSTGTGDSVDEGKTPYQGDENKSAEDYMKEIKQMFTDEFHFARTRGLDLSKLTLPN